MGAEGNITTVVDPRILGEVERAAARCRIPRARQADKLPVACNLGQLPFARQEDTLTSRGDVGGERDLPAIVDTVGLKVEGKFATLRPRGWTRNSGQLRERVSRWGC